jgi:uncharacterized repeat protein (TIGR03943 family)
MTPDDYLKRSLPAAVYGVWACTFLYLTLGQRYMAFLRPEFGLLLGLAAFLALGFGISGAMHARVHAVDFSFVSRALALLTPVVFLMLIPEAHLGNYAFRNRFVGYHAPVDGSRAAPGSVSQSRTPAISEESGRPGGEAAEQTILEILRNPQAYDGRPVSFSGMILRDESLKQNFGGRDTLVYRFLITCCASDALPLAIVLDSAPAAALRNDQWVQVKGTFQLLEVDQKQLPFVARAVVDPIPAPKFPYLF